MKKVIRVVAALLLFLPVFSVQAGTQNPVTKTEQIQLPANNAAYSGNAHALGWKGVVQPSRGGTGTSTAMTKGSILFAGSSGIYSQDNANLFWDDTNKNLGLGGNIMFSPQFDHRITAADPSLPNNGGASIQLAGSNGNGRGAGGAIYIDGGAADVSGTGGNIQIQGGQGGSDSGDAGNVIILGGNPSAGNSSGGNIIIKPGQYTGAGSVGYIKFGDPISGFFGAFDLSRLNSDRNIGFQDASGTLSLLESDQTFTGLNKFEAKSNSTIYVGSSTKSGCIALGDSDGIGTTYVIANNGVLAVFSTKPSICQ